ncbi:hypothetical protein D3C75_1273290 [compost metagenome]
MQNAEANVNLQPSPMGYKASNTMDSTWLVAVTLPTPMQEHRIVRRAVPIQVGQYIGRYVA